MRSASRSMAALVAERHAGERRWARAVRAAGFPSRLVPVALCRLDRAWLDCPTTPWACLRWAPSAAARVNTRPHSGQVNVSLAAACFRSRATASHPPMSIAVANDTRTRPRLWWRADTVVSRPPPRIGGRVGGAVRFLGWRARLSLGSSRPHWAQPVVDTAPETIDFGDQLGRRDVRAPRPSHRRSVACCGCEASVSPRNWIIEAGRRGSVVWAPAGAELRLGSTCRPGLPPLAAASFTFCSSCCGPGSVWSGF